MYLNIGWNYYRCRTDIYGRSSALWRQDARQRGIDSIHPQEVPPENADAKADELSVKPEESAKEDPKKKSQDGKWLYSIIGRYSLLPALLPLTTTT